MSDEPDHDEQVRADFADDLAAAIEDAFDADATFAERAGERGADIREDHELDLDADAVVERMNESPYDDVERTWNWAVGDVCAASESCTDSRPYRVEGFGEVGPTGEW